MGTQAADTSPAPVNPEIPETQETPETPPEPIDPDIPEVPETPPEQQSEVHLLSFAIYLFT